MGFMVKNSHILQLLGVNECFNMCSHLVLVGLGLGDRLAIVGIPRGGTFGKALALTILNHIDTLKEGSAVYLQKKKQYLGVGLQEGANRVPVTCCLRFLIRDQGDHCEVCLTTEKSGQ